MFIIIKYLQMENNIIYCKKIKQLLFFGCSILFKNKSVANTKEFNL